MHRLRSTALLARFVLAWFVVSVGAAMASPLVQPRGLQLVCGAGAVKLLPQDDGDAPASALKLDCAFCTPAVVPPPAAQAVPAVAQPTLPPAQHLQMLREGAEVQGPLARGPPQRARG